MLKIGLTGGIGSGKTTVARIFEVLGIPVYYADEASKKLMNEDAELKESIQLHFGEDAYINDQLNRSYISSIVFKDPGKLALLNSITHPATIRDAAAWLKRQTTPYAVKEAALIFESGSQQGLDIVIGVYAPEAVRIQRSMHRDNTSREEVISRINKQIDESIKMRLCDHVIINDGLQLVIPQVLELHQQFMSKGS